MNAARTAARRLGALLLAAAVVAAQEPPAAPPSTTRPAPEPCAQSRRLAEKLVAAANASIEERASAMGKEVQRLWQVRNRQFNEWVAGRLPSSAYGATERKANELSAEIIELRKTKLSEADIRTLGCDELKGWIGQREAEDPLAAARARRTLQREEEQTAERERKEDEDRAQREQAAARVRAEVERREDRRALQIALLAGMDRRREGEGAAARAEGERAAAPPSPEEPRPLGPWWRESYVPDGAALQSYDAAVRERFGTSADEFVQEQMVSIPGPFRYEENGRTVEVPSVHVHRDLAGDVQALLSRARAGDFGGWQPQWISGFNVRPARGSRRYSEHSYGLALDVDGHFEENELRELGPRIPPGWTAEAGFERLPPRPSEAQIRRRHAFLESRGHVRLPVEAVLFLTRRGFTWGGAWNSLVDPMHFERRPRSRR